MYLPRYRKFNGRTYVPVPGPDEDVITMSYESCHMLRRNGGSANARNIKSLIFLSQSNLGNVSKSALLASLLRLSNVLTYDVHDFYNLFSIAHKLVDDGDVLVAVSDVSEGAAAASLVLSSSRGPISVIRSDALSNAVPLVPNERSRGDAYAELFMKAISKFIHDVISNAGISPREVKYVATNLRDLRYAAKVLKSLGVSDSSLEPSKYVSTLAYFGDAHSVLALVRSLELANAGDYILFMNLNNFSNFVASVLRVDEDISSMRGCVSYLEHLLQAPQIISR